MRHIVAISFVVTTALVFCSSSIFAQQNNAAYDSLITIHSICITGNKVTKEKIILRELHLKPGSTIKATETDTFLQLCKQQLVNLALFNVVRVSFQTDSAGHNELHIFVVERWYIWPVPIFQIADRNFNQWWITKDPERINYGMEFVKYNVRGRNETLRIKLQDGFTRKAEATYSFPWIDKKQQVGASFKVTYLRNREIWYATAANKLQYYRDKDEAMLSRFTAGFTLRLRKKLYRQGLLSLYYNDVVIGDTVVSKNINPDYLLNGQKRQQSFTLSYTFIDDKRDFKAYPLKGRYTMTEIGHIGLGLSKDINLGYLYFAHDRYYEVRKKQYASFGFKTKLTLPERQPYYNYRALGYADFVRGYEYYVVDGQHFFLLKGQYNFSVYEAEWKLNFIPFNQFRIVPFNVYAGAFSDWGYAVNNMFAASNTYANTLLYGYGVGLNFVAYYDRVLRTEVAMNRQGRAGFYVHLYYPF